MKGLAIGFPAGSASPSIIFGDSYPRIVTPLSGGYDMPLNLRLSKGMSGGLFAHEGTRAIKGILALHADPAWSQDLTYVDGSRVQELLQHEYERMSFAISSEQILLRLRPLLQKHNLCPHHATRFKLESTNG